MGCLGGPFLYLKFDIYRDINLFELLLHLKI